MSQEFKYFAFISYNSKDVKWGSKLQRKLEGYKMSAMLCSENGWKRTPLKPIFFAPTDIQPNDLTEELRARLHASRHLIVVCSPNSAQSEWVGKEIAYFYSLGRVKNIHFFIVDGEPNSSDPKTECFNPEIKRLGLDGVLGANINERNYSWRYLNRQRAYVQLITKLLGIEFDTIWQRHKRQLIRKWLAVVTLIIAVVSAVVWAWSAYRPITVNVALEEQTVVNNNLPPLSDAEVTLVIGDDVRHLRLNSIDDIAQFTNVPKNLLGSEAELRFVHYPDSPDSRDYLPVVMPVKLSENITLPILRDTVKYGHIRARVVDKNMVLLPNYALDIAGVTVVSDENGDIDTVIPFALQRQTYEVEGNTLSDVGLTSRFAIVVKEE